MVQASGPFGGTSYWEEIQNSHEGLYTPSGHGMPWDSLNDQNDVAAERDMWGSFLYLLDN